MKTIEEIAKLLCLCAEAGEKCKTCSSNEDGCNNMRCSDFRQYDAAKRAIKLAQEWIDIKYEQPEIGTEILVRIKNYAGSGVYRIGLDFYSCDCMDRTGMTAIFTNFGNAVTHWRYIELK